MREKIKNLIRRFITLVLITVGLLARILTVPLSIAGLVLLSINAPSFIVTMLDTNLAAIKFAVSFVPAPYGAMSEVALREGLGADSAMIFWESWLAVKLAFWLIARLFRRVPGQDASTKKEVSK